jgi:hypothetical protein
MDCTSSKNVIFSKCWALLEQKGWHAFSLEAVCAHEKQLSLDRIHFYFPQKASVIEHFMKTITQKAWSSFEAQPTFKDTVFECILLRLELLQPHKSLLSDMVKDQQLWPSFCKILGVDFFKAFQGVWGLAVVILYGYVFFYWLSHTDEEVMVFLEETLTKLSSIYSMTKASFVI